MRSFERINYSIRPNKHIERRLMFDALQTLEPYLRLSDYRYVGLGSMWFADFVLAHKLLHIGELISIEAHEEDAKRAEFNRPYKSVRVIDGTTSMVLPTIDLSQRKAILWMDYDGQLEASVLSDLGLICSAVPNASIVMVTLNANPPRANNGANREKLLRGIAGSLVPPSLPPKFFDRVPEEYPNSLAQMLFVHLAVCLKNAGRAETLYPLFHFYYSDGAPMITIGAVIADSNTWTELRSWRSMKPPEWVIGKQQYIIDTPHLTPREKLIFDQLLPADPEGVAAALAELKLPFSARDVERYAKFYRYYPLFAEFLP